MYYSVIIKRHNWKEDRSWQEHEWLLVKAGSVEEVLRKITTEYPQHSIEKIEESHYTGTL